MKTELKIESLLSWYDAHARVLPWRISPSDRRRDIKPDPYAVWLSEVMLQQTTVQTVTAYFNAFIQRWPTVLDLAQAHEQEVMKLWAGLGYYSRARNLKKCADLIADKYDAVFPQTEAALLKLPGVGPYTAAAIAAIAFDAPATVVDGNIERVISRLYAIQTPLPDSKPDIRAYMSNLTPHARPGDFAQAMMDLGATICTPRKANCTLCPWTSACQARAQGLVNELPRKQKKRAKPTRKGMAFVVTREDGAILLRRRPTKGLLGGMSEPPTSDWGETAPTDDLSIAPHGLDWKKCQTPVRHTFTHFHLEMTVWKASAPCDFPTPPEHWWSTTEMIADEALPTVMRKALAKIQ